MEKKKEAGGIAKVLSRLVLAALLIYSAVALYDLQNQIHTARQREAELAHQVAQLTEENEALRADIKEAGSAEKMEEIAREKLGMVKNGEKVFYTTGS